jgi:aminoglycoside 3'-phosphotransferase I
MRKDTMQRLVEIIDSEEPCSPVGLPPNFSAELAGYEWLRNTVGESGGEVYRLYGKAGAPDLFLKYGEGALADDVSDEMARLRWLGRHVPMPEVAHFVRTHTEAWLLMTAMSGETAFQVMQAHPERRIAIVDAIAEFLRRIHAIPVGLCPFTSNHENRMLLARARIDAKLVDEEDFDEERDGWTAEQVWNTMLDLLPLAPDPVVTHGDYSLDNLLIHDGEVAGCIDAGRAGIADRYQDLAIAWNCLGEFGAPLQERFLAQYGVQDLDRRKLEFHLMLDELF